MGGAANAPLAPWHATYRFGGVWCQQMKAANRAEIRTPLDTAVAGFIGTWDGFEHYRQCPPDTPLWRTCSL